MQVVAAHNNIVDAIRMRDPKATSIAMRFHLQKFARDMSVQPVTGR
jgi:DNA-binding FadR family transcriptional regulator